MSFIGRFATLSFAISIGLTLVTAYALATAPEHHLRSDAGSVAPMGVPESGRNVPRASSSLPTSSGEGPDETGLHQTVTVAIIPGRLSVSPTGSIASLKQEAQGFFVGNAPITRVVDARGSLRGWSAFATIREVIAMTAEGPIVIPDAEVSVVPLSLQVIDGSRAGLGMGEAASASAGGRTLLFGADTLFGGGTYQAQAMLKVQLTGIEAHRVEVLLETDVI